MRSCRNTVQRPSKMVPTRVNAFPQTGKDRQHKASPKGCGKASHHHQTSSLESFHSVILRFAPKNVVFPFTEMLCRFYLATMKMETVNRQLHLQDNLYYVADFMKLVLEEVFVNPAPFVDKLKQILIPALLSSDFEKPSKEEVVGRHVS
ncbi:hypothetical protein QQF64_018591 [Cirrhinus molitorella]|uniref:Uncharacterized protein n=1 Tax=Cirrhinus molitorella TaxID=172907 RepID=A0ABR3LEN5_9TELE